MIVGPPILSPPPVPRRHIVASAAATEEAGAVAFDASVRHPSRSGLRVEIPLPEDPVGAGWYEATVLETSPRGMKLELADMPKSFYRRMMRRCRLARVAIDAPDSPALGEERTGRIEWCALHEDRPGSPTGRCQCFVGFGDAETDSREAFAVFRAALLGDRRFHSFVP